MSIHEDLSFEVSIPSAILLNPNIDPSAIKLYAFIKGLTRAHGYCFATNDYLAQLMHSDGRTVQRQLSSLRKEGFLEVHVRKNGAQWQRHIYLKLNLKKCLGDDTDVTPPRHPCHPPTTSVSPISSKRADIRKRDIEREERVSAPTPESPPLFCHKRVRMEQAKFDDLVQKFGAPKVMEIMERLDEYADINPKRFRQYACHAAVLRKWIREDAEKAASQAKNPPVIFGTQKIDRSRKDANGNRVTDYDNLF